jgi:anti-repressor protein
MGARDLMAGVATMTSLELVALVNEAREAGRAELRHADFMAKLERHPGIDSTKFLAQYKDSTGRTVKCYRLPKRESELMVMSESLAVQTRVYDRLAEMDAGALPKLPQTYAQALRLAAEQAETIEAQAEQLAIAAPKVAFAEAIRSIDGVCHIEKIAKTLGHGRNKFFKRLREDGILMRSNLPYQKYIDREYFTVNEQEPYTDKEGVKHPTFTAMVTGAGQVFLARKYPPTATGAAA